MRLIAATHRDLASHDSGRDSSARIFSIVSMSSPLRFPPLRERREDIPLLVNYFVSKVSGRMGDR